MNITRDMDTQGWSNAQLFIIKVIYIQIYIQSQHIHVCPEFFYKSICVKIKMELFIWQIKLKI